MQGECEAYLCYKIRVSEDQGEEQKCKHDLLREGREAYIFVTIAEIQFSLQNLERGSGQVVVPPSSSPW